MFACRLNRLAAESRAAAAGEAPGDGGGGAVAERARGGEGAGASGACCGRVRATRDDRTRCPYRHPHPNPPPQPPGREAFWPTPQLRKNPLPLQKLSTPIEETAEIKLAYASPIPTTFGPSRPAVAPFQLTSDAPTSDLVFASDVTGSIGNPLRDPDKFKAPRRKRRKRRAPARQARRHDADQARAQKAANPTVQEKLW